MDPTNLQNANHDMTKTITENHLWHYLPALCQTNRKGRDVAHAIAPRVFALLEAIFSPHFPPKAWENFVSILFWGQVPDKKSIRMQDVNFLFYHTLKALYPEHFSQVASGAEAKTLFCWMSKETVNAKSIRWNWTAKNEVYGKGFIHFDLGSVIKKNPSTYEHQTFSRLTNFMLINTISTYDIASQITPVAGWCRHINGDLTQFLGRPQTTKWMEEITLQASGQLKVSQIFNVERIFVFLIKQGINPSESVIVDRVDTGWADMYDNPVYKDITMIPTEVFGKLVPKSPHFVAALPPPPQ
ncbi:MAG: hypothetical protein JSR58_06385 [Verrucomicrobia bacterium]|nr:hypothetical protein [Verrucomicrobiota bacterium]